MHLGIAVDTEQGLLSPVIHNAGDLSLAGLARAIADIAKRARSGGLKPDELAGGTFTITNIGSQGALFDTPILVPPQAAMLGTGAIVKRPVVVTDEAGSEIRSASARCATCRSPTITASSTAPTPDASSPPSSSVSRAERSRRTWGCSRRMRVVIAGSSGLIGTALVASLRRTGTTSSASCAVARGPRRVRLGTRGRRTRQAALAGADAVVNLCGVGIGDKRWTGAYKQELRDSRITSTDVLAARRRGGDCPSWSTPAVCTTTATPAIASSTKPRPSARVSCPPCAGTGRPRRHRPRRRAPGRCCCAAHVGARQHGGMLGRLKPLYTLGLGGRLGSGRQYFPWISLDDEIGAIKFVLDGRRRARAGERDRAGTGHQRRVQQRDRRTRCTGPRPGIVPGSALVVVVGEFAQEGILARPARHPTALEQAGFRFPHNTIGEALEAALG